MPIDFPANPTNGQVFSNWIYDSSITAWRNVNTDTGVAALNTMGLRNVVPTSIQVGSGSATVNANGTVSFSGATSISLNNVFTSTYTNYRILLNVTNTSTTAQPSNFRLRNAGTDLTASNYQWMVVNIQFSLVRMLGSSGVAQAEIGYSGGTDNSFFAVTDISNPFATAKTYATTSRTYNNENSTGGFWVNNSNSYDGFSIYPQTGNFTGTVQVYGYTN